MAGSDGFRTRMDWRWEARVKEILGPVSTFEKIIPTFNSEGKNFSCNLSGNAGQVAPCSCKKRNRDVCMHVYMYVCIYVYICVYKVLTGPNLTSLAKSLSGFKVLGLVR